MNALARAKKVRHCPHVMCAPGFIGVKRCGYDIKHQPAPFPKRQCKVDNCPELLDDDALWPWCWHCVSKHRGAMYRKAPGYAMPKLTKRSKLQAEATKTNLQAEIDQWLEKVRVHEQCWGVSTETPMKCGWVLHEHKTCPIVFMLGYTRYTTDYTTAALESFRYRIGRMPLYAFVR